MDTRLSILVLFISSVFFNSATASDYHMTFHKQYYVTYSYVRKPRVVSVGLKLFDLKKHRHLSPTDIIYNEILSYSEEVPFGDEHGRSTNVHETVHGINSKIRNSFKIKYKKNLNGFYAGAGKGILVENPPIKMRDVVPFIPDVVKGYRYNLYFVKQLGDWDDTPTYPMDEWSAYIAGAECAVDDATRDIKLKEKSDSVSGALEFSIYCAALALTVKNKCPDYWSENEQFRNIIKYYLIKSEKVFFEGKGFFPSEKQESLLINLREHKDTLELRQFLLEEFDGIFVD
jgi:hypothetical protein